ncbi:uncharacterized protein CCR75_007336 [Bremia lactucae]|uniref:MAGE domain-containing protein n=1 Tax=Bremia lactucae TaxID=4779 RepID=A0A976FEY3_BRELC|nr:hypothetical protein CCR75_007336 [Bremia lactucae]
MHRSQRSRHRDLVESRAASEDGVMSANIVEADASGDDENDGDDEAILDFTQTDYAIQMSQVETYSSESDSVEGESKLFKEPTKPKALHKLSDKALDELTAKLVRYMVYKGGLKLPIKFADITKDVFPQFKNVSRYFFYYAKQKLEVVFGYRVVHVDDSISKEMYLVLNNASSQEHLLLMNKNGRAATRGFLMMVLGLLWCAPSRQLLEGWKLITFR